MTFDQFLLGYSGIRNRRDTHRVQPVCPYDNGGFLNLSAAELSWPTRLTAGTKVSTSLTDYGFLDEGLASAASLSLTTIHLKFLLVGPSFPVTVHIVPHAGSTVPDPLLQNPWDGLEQKDLLSSPQRPDSPGRVNASLEKRLIRINVPDPCNKALI